MLCKRLHPWRGSDFAQKLELGWSMGTEGRNVQGSGWGGEQEALSLQIPVGPALELSPTTGSCPGPDPAQLG